MENKKIDSLTGLRFIAIVLIVLSHLWILERCMDKEIYQTYLCNAQLGVDFFFMLSGFGMMLSYMRKEQNNDKISIYDMITFAWKHVKKMYALYVITLLISIPEYMCNDMYKYGGTLIHAIKSTIMKLTVTLPLLQSAFGMTKFNHSFNSVTWFLSTLFCIYLVSPFILRFMKSKVVNIKSSIYVAVASIVISCVLGFIFMFADQYTMFDDLYYGSPYRRVFYVICGMAIAKIYLLREKEIPACTEYMVVILSIIWFFARNTIFNSVGALCVIIDMILCASVLYVFAVGNGNVSKFLSSKIMLYLGDISMYIFLTHYLIVIYVEKIIDVLNFESVISILLAVVFILGLTMLLSNALYQHDKK